MKTLLLLFGLLISLFSFSQNFTSNGQSLGNSSSFGVDVADLDGDSDLDAFVSNGYGSSQTNQVWLNDGNGNFTNSGQNLGNTSYGTDVDLGDLDNDGDIDAYVTNRFDPDEIWINDGSANFTLSSQTLGIHNALILGDLDGDGDLDAFVTSNASNEVWLNNGNGIFINTNQALGNEDSEGVALGDFDSDGDLDAFVTNLNASNEVWLNDGNGTFTNSGQNLGNGQGYDVKIGDLDTDGDLDAFVANNGGGQANQIWLNDGNGSFTNGGQSLGNSHSNAVCLTDLDGDCDLDAFVANNLEPSQVWLNDGSGVFTNSGQNIGSSPFYAIDAAVGDFDNDGDSDIFEAIENNNPNNVWINNTTQTCCIPTSSTDIITACDSYSWIDGNTYTASNNSATYTTINAEGCDSTITLDLTINSSSQSSFIVEGLDSYTSPSGDVYTTGGVYTDTIPNAAGCDSIIIIDLSLNFTGIGELNNSPKQLIKIVDVLGRETPFKPNTPLLYIYNDGTVERKMVLK